MCFPSHNLLCTAKYSQRQCAVQTPPLGFIPYHYTPSMMPHTLWQRAPPCADLLGPYFVQELVFVLSMATSAVTLSALLRAGKKIVAVAKNYEDHITELAHLQPKVWDTTKEKDPVFFLKPTTSYAFPGEPLVLPRSMKGSAHYEVVCPLYAPPPPPGAR